MAFLAFFLSFMQMAVLLAAYWLKQQSLFLLVAYYGSPIYLLMNMIGGDSFIMSGNMLLIGCMTFHLVKYALYLRARFNSDGGPLFWSGAVLEASYLCISAYYLN